MLGDYSGTAPTACAATFAKTHVEWRRRVSNFVGLATHLPWRAVPGESTELFEFFPPAPNAGAGSEISVFSVAEKKLAHPFGHSPEAKDHPGRMKMAIIITEDISVN